MTHHSTARAVAGPQREHGSADVDSRPASEPQEGAFRPQGGRHDPGRRREQAGQRERGSQRLRSGGQRDRGRQEEEEGLLRRQLSRRAGGEGSKLYIFAFYGGAVMKPILSTSRRLTNPHAELTEQFEVEHFWPGLGLVYKQSK